MGHYSKNDENIIVTKMKQVDIMPKLRTIQGGEDDEPMTHQIIDTKNYYVNSNKSIGDFRSLLVFGLGVSIWLKNTSREIKEYVLLPYLHPVYFLLELICAKSKR